MNRFVSAGLIALAALTGAAAAPAPSTSPPHVEVVAPLTPEQQADWNCLDAAAQAWDLRPVGAQAPASPSTDTLKALKSYYLGRLSAEIGDERLVRFLHEARLRTPKPIAWTKAPLAACQARMERSAAALRPMEAKDFALERAGASAQ